MKTIQLTKGLSATVDDWHYDHLMQWRWRAEYFTHIKGYYATRWERDRATGKKKRILMHREVMREYLQGEFATLCIDHLNHLGLDNQEDNLRLTRQRGNAQNQRNQAKFGVGVKYNPRNGTNPFQARIIVGKKYVHLGSFPTPEAAQAAYWEAVKKYDPDHHCRRNL